MSKPQLSPQAFDRLKEELVERTTTRRREITTLIARAREHGDLRENADYDAAKNEQGLNEARVRQLEAMLNQAVVVQSDGANGVEAGCIVAIRFVGDDDTMRYLVGSIEEQQDDLEILSSSSPLGLALLGGHPGDQRTYEGPRGELTVEIVSVEAP